MRLCTLRQDGVLQYCCQLLALHSPPPVLSQKLLLSLAQNRDDAAQTQAVPCIAETTNWSDIAKKERKRLTQSPLRRNGATDCTQSGQSDPLSKG